MKWKNYGLWISIASILYMVLRDIGIDIDLTKWQNYVTAILGILATLGVISNPEQGRGYYQLKPKANNSKVMEESVTQIMEKSVTQVMEKVEYQKSQEPNNDLPNSEMTNSRVQEPQKSQNSETMESSPQQIHSNMNPTDDVNSDHNTQGEIPPRINIGERLPYEK